MTSPKDSIELIEMVEEAFKTYPWQSLNWIWLTLQSVMNRIIEQRGDNKFKYPIKNYPWQSPNWIWLTLQSVMNKIIKERGDSKFKVPHMNKEKMERINELQVSLVVTPEANSFPLNTLVE
jgi:hypothetical protein